MAALRDYVEFGPVSSSPAVRSTSAPSDVSPRKGMLRADAEEAFGKPVESSTSREGTLTITKLVFVTDDQRITADFVDDVMIRYTISSK